MAKGGTTTAVVLLSGGLDSSYNLLKACAKFTVRMALTFDYGQKAATRELERSERMARHFKVDHEIVKLPWFSTFTRTSLLSDEAIPSGKDIEIDSLERSLETAKSVWVPNRNGIFLNIAAGFAEGLEADVVIPGFNLEEAQTFPDNSAAFLKVLDQSWSYSTEGRVRTHCFSTTLTKTQIVADALVSALPFSMLWPCYLDGEEWCGQCESCLRFKRAVQANGLSFEDLREVSA